ncbi:MAG: POTRA domain-containing protein [Bacteroidales bacterium]
MIDIKKISVLLLIVCIAVINSYAQKNDPFLTPQEYTIAEIKVEGIEYLQPLPIIKTTGLQVGQTITIPGPEISNIITTLWKQDLFADVKIYASKIEGDDIYLTIFLQERARLNSVSISGVKKSEESDIRDLIDFNLHMQVNENKKNIAKKKIVDYLQEKGYYNVEVDIQETLDTVKFNRSNVHIDISKNERVKIESINISGNSEFSDWQLRRTMKNTKRKSWFILKRSKYIPDVYEEDKKKIIEKYKTNGYRDMVIEHDSVYFIDSSLLKIDIHIDEGTKYFYRNISWRGNSEYSTELLSAILKIKSGDVYNDNYLQERIFGMDGVSSVYLDNGYLFFNAEPIETKVEGDSVDIQIRIYEGPQAVIDKVTVKGNTKTNDHVIYREIRTRPG